MVCRCATPAIHAQRQSENDAYRYQTQEQSLLKQIEKLKTEIASLTPDASRFQIMEVEEVSKNLVLKVRFPSCKDCSFEGDKILVYFNVSSKDALKWKKIDPHFKINKTQFNEAPSPCGRFPSTPSGWKDAVEYAKNKKE